MKRMNRYSALLALLVLCCGCASEPPGPNPIEQLQMVIANLPDSATKPDRFKSFFVAGAAPGDADRMKYRAIMLRAKTATQSGETATVRVQVEDVQGIKLGEVDWTAVKEGPDWKLKTAPLP